MQFYVYHDDEHVHFITDPVTFAKTTYCPDTMKFTGIRIEGENPAEALSGYCNPGDYDGKIEYIDEPKATKQNVNNKYAVRIAKIFTELDNTIVELAESLAKQYGCDVDELYFHIRNTFIEKYLD